MTAKLSALMDCRMIQEETGLKRTAAEALMRAVPTVKIDGVRKTYVRREDVAAYLERQTAA